MTCEQQEVVGNEMMDAALTYARMGWPVFPCRRNGKEPLTPHGFKDATADEATIQGGAEIWPDCNIGVVTTGSLFVLDVDPKNGGDASLAWVESQHGKLPPTVTAITGGGGRHFWFRDRTGKARNTNGSIAKGIDTRGEGGYVIAPPSIHASGNGYVWADDKAPGDIEIADAPDWLLDLMHGDKTQDLFDGPFEAEAIAEEDEPDPDDTDESSTDCRSAEPASTSEMQRAATYARKAATSPSISGCRGHDRLFAVCGALYRKFPSLSSQQMLDIIRTQFNPLCDPPWSEKEIAHKVEDIFKTPRQIASPSHKALPPNKYLRNDLGNAERFVHLFGQDVQWCDQRQKWFVWDGYWREDDARQVGKYAEQTVRAIFDEARAADSMEVAEDLGKWAGTSCNAAKIKAMLELVKNKVAISIDCFDADPWLLGVQNGVVDLSTGRLRTARRDDYITKLTACAFDSDAQAPRFEQFLDEIFDGDKELVRWLQRYLGYCLTGDVRDHVLPICWGVGANCKSTLWDCVMGMMGDYAAAAPPSLLTARGSDEHPTEIAFLQGKRLVVATETEEGRKLKVQLVKQTTGDGTLTARYMRGDFFTFARTHKTVMMTNNRPRVNEDSLGIWRRLKLVPFNVTFDGNRADRGLSQMLKTEWSGILAWSVRGCLEWQKKGLGDAKAIRLATSDYRHEEDSIGQFLAENCKRAKKDVAPKTHVFTAYKKWAEDNHEQVLDVKAFSHRVRAHGYEDGQRKLAGRTQRVWLGMKLTTFEPDDVEGAEKTLA